MKDDAVQTEADPIDDSRLKFSRMLLKWKAGNGVRSPHFWIISFLMVTFTCIFYFVIKDWHTLYLFLFLYPLLYAAVVFRMSGVVITGIVFILVLIPYFWTVSNDAYVFVWTIFFAVFSILLCGLIATLLNYLETRMKAYEELIALNRELNRHIQQMEDMQKQLIASQRLSAAGELSASVAHEINNYLSGILVYCKLLARKVAGGRIDRTEMAADLSRMEDAVNQSTGISRGLLDFSRRSEPNPERVNLVEVIERVLTLVGHRAVAGKVEILWESRQPAYVLADTRQMQQVFLNLMINAIQAMPDGGKLTLSIYSDPDGWVRAAVRDTGTGIAPENMDKLFKPFFTTRGEEGTGLGLSVSHDIIQRYGGRIEVQSEPGKGSTFTVFLPACKAEDRENGTTI